MEWMALIGFVGMIISNMIGYRRGRKSMKDIVEDEHMRMCRYVHSFTTNELIAIIWSRYEGKPTRAEGFWKAYANEREASRKFEITNEELKALEEWSEAKTSGYGYKFTAAMQAAHSIRGRHKRDEGLRGKG